MLVQDRDTSLLTAYGLGLGGRGSRLVVISLILTSLCLLLVLCRILARVQFTKRLGSDDYVIVFSLCAAMSMTVANCLAVNHGYGRHSTTITESNLHNALKYFWVLQIVYKVTINATKTSILLLYLRIFPSKGFRCSVFIVMTFVLCYATASIVATIMECQPLARVWNKSIPGSCLDLTAFWYANAAASILTDLVILALPMPKIKALQLPIRQKVGLFMVFALGGFVCVTSILRMITLNPASKSTDQTYGTLISTTWTTIEANTGIICANLPVLKAPLSMLFPRLFNSHLSIGESLSLGRRYSRRTPASTSRENSAASRRDQYGDTLTLNPSNTSTERPMTGESTESIVRVESTGPPIRGIKKTTDVKVQFAEADDFNLIHSRLKDNGRLHGPHIV